jgi:hypothetical protein
LIAVRGFRFYATREAGKELQIARIIFVVRFRHAPDRRGAKLVDGFTGNLLSNSMHDDDEMLAQNGALKWF